MKHFIFVACVFLTHLAYAGRTIYITAGTFGNVFDLHPRIGNAQITCNRFKQAAEKLGYTVKQTDTLNNLQDVAYIIAFDVNSVDYAALQKYSKHRCILFLWEPPTVAPHNYDVRNHEPFATIFTWHDALVDNVRYFKFHYPQPSLCIEPGNGAYQQKKLCTMIACNKHSADSRQLYSERVRAIEFFEQYAPTDFDLYGVGWDGQKYTTHKGSVADKQTCLQQYKFCICYENCRDCPGYVTEKIFDCLVAGCVPVYLGARNIHEYVPRECYIDRRNFASYHELYTYLHTMSEQQYQNYQQAIQTYVHSVQAQQFSSQGFIDTVVRGLKLVDHAHAADLVIFSYDRPLQLYALLESLHTYVSGVGQVHVIYRTSNQAFDDGYFVVQQAYPEVIWHKQGQQPDQDFKALLVRCFKTLPHSYVLFAVDDIVVTDCVNLCQCSAALSVHNAYGFYLRLGLNTVKTDMGCGQQPLPPLHEQAGVYCWQFGQACKEWAYAHTVDMTLYKKSDIVRFIEQLSYTNPNSFEAAWSGYGDPTHKGLCYSRSKVVNLPLNRVQTVYANKAQDISPATLLTMFQQGYKMDIQPLHTLAVNEPHMWYTPTFVKRIGM